MSDLRYRSSPNGDIGGETDLWDWDVWEAEREERNREHAEQEREERDRCYRAKLSVLLDEIERLELRAYLLEQCVLGVLDAQRDLHERWMFERRLLADVLREQREGA